MAETVRNLEPIVSALGCGAVVVNDAGSVRCANARFADMVGEPRPALCDRTLAALLSPLQSAGGDLPRLLACADTAEGEAHLVRKAGEPLPVLVLRGALGHVDGLAGLHIVLFVDLSAQKNAEARQHAHLAEVSRLGDTVIEQAIALKRYAHDLEERVRARTIELHEANLDSIYMLAVASEAKDADTGAHVLRIQRGSAGIALAMGLGARQAEEIGYSSILHDVGKMMVPDQILRKPAKLTPEEREIIQEHTLAGERILSTKPFFAAARRIARSHHENWDGSGYPDQIRGDAIPLEARIVHVADVFDALTAERVYKPAWPMDKALAFLNEQRGVMFDPQVLSAFTRYLASAGTGVTDPTG